MRLGRAVILSAAVFCAILLVRTHFAAADTVDDLQSKIDTRSADITRLEREIASYQAQIDTLGTQERSLTQTLKALDLTQKKLQANIALTQDKIDAKNLEVQQLNKSIGGATDSIADNRKYIAESFKKMAESNTASTLEIILAGKTVAGVWNSINALALVESSLQDNVEDLSKTRATLELNKKRTEKAKSELIGLQKQLSNEKNVIVATKAEQNKLLSDTKSSEVAYQALLKEKLRLKEAFERELADYESALKLSVDLSKLPTTGSSVLSWPIDKVTITQYFGNTPFATANPQLYKGSGHNGVDFRATTGTPIKAALSGTVVGQGNTDIYYGCYSLGKWILLQHSNGLSTLYAHLSFQSVSTGASVNTSDVIGYSGNTGYTTGPHLHFGVYATSGIEIKRFTESRSCKGATLPIAVLSAYLNPLSYLPRF